MILTLFSNAEPGTIGYLAKFSQMQNTTISASPSVVVTITCADLQGLYVRLLEMESTIGILPRISPEGKEQTHPQIIQPQYNQCVQESAI